jgi:hypothetical protein
VRLEDVVSALVARDAGRLGIVGPVVSDSVQARYVGLVECYPKLDLRGKDWRSCFLKGNKP